MISDRLSAARTTVLEGLVCFALVLCAPVGVSAAPVQADTAQAGPEAASLALPTAQATDAAPEAPKPPRIDGGYFGGSVPLTLGFKRINGLDTPTPFLGSALDFRTGDAVFDWMTIGMELMLTFDSSNAKGGQQDKGGQLLIDFGFYPKPSKPLSFRAAFGFGGGRVTQADGASSGYGGAAFKAALRYEFFPNAHKYRPHTAGGMGLGPEFGFLANTPGRPGGPMSNTVYLALAFTWYRGR